jgi:uncharacterized protein (DUF433 family)
VGGFPSCTITVSLLSDISISDFFTGSQFMSRHIVADPRVCHGKPTFRGTRILVSDVLDQVASGMAWESIIEEWNGSITQEAIKEAVQLASQALLSHAHEFFERPTAA